MSHGVCGDPLDWIKKHCIKITFPFITYIFYNHYHTEAKRDILRPCNKRKLKLADFLDIEFQYNERESEESEANI